MMTLLVNLKKTMFKVITVEQKEIYKITESKVTADTTVSKL